MQQKLFEVNPILLSSFISSHWTRAEHRNWKFSQHTILFLSFKCKRLNAWFGMLQLDQDSQSKSLLTIVCCENFLCPM